MGLFDDLQSRAADMFGGTDLGGTAEDLSNSAQDAGSSLQDLSTDMQDQITQYAEDHNISIDAAREHILGGK